MEYENQIFDDAIAIDSTRIVHEIEFGALLVIFLLSILTAWIGGAILGWIIRSKCKPRATFTNDIDR